jgi:hypothetical protein
MSHDLLFEPGSGVFYNNTGYFFLGMLIEKVTGKKYDEVLEEKIFRPLGMSHSGYSAEGKIIEKMASGHMKTFTGDKAAPHMDIGNLFSGGGIYTTVDDLFLWDQALYTTSILTDESKQRAFKGYMQGERSRSLAQDPDGVLLDAARVRACEADAAPEIRVAPRREGFECRHDERGVGPTREPEAPAQPLIERAELITREPRRDSAPSDRACVRKEPFMEAVAIGGEPSQEGIHTREGRCERPPESSERPARTDVDHVDVGGSGVGEEVLDSMAAPGVRMSRMANAMAAPSKAKPRSSGTISSKVAAIASGAPAAMAALYPSTKNRPMLSSRARAAGCAPRKSRRAKVVSSGEMPNTSRRNEASREGVRATMLQFPMLSREFKSLGAFAGARRFAEVWDLRSIEHHTGDLGEGA